MLEEVILVDEQDNVLGLMEKMEAHRLAKLHRAFSVFAMNDQNEILLQRRALHKYHSVFGQILVVHIPEMEKPLRLLQNVD